MLWNSLKYWMLVILRSKNFCLDTSEFHLANFSLIIYVIISTFLIYDLDCCNINIINNRSTSHKIYK
jgi:hypothetical protein